MAISLHVVVDQATNEELDRALIYLIRTNQRVVNIAAGSQVDRGMQFVERVRQALPHIDIIWRQLEDTGLHAKLTVDQWWVSRIAPLLSWMLINRVIPLLDNESSGDDAEIQRYAAWELDALTRLHGAGLNGAVCRFATGNIRDGVNDQYKYLKPLLDGLRPGDHVSPNEYSNAPGKSSSGHLARYKNIELVAGKQLNVSIGEAGVAPDYNPSKGYRSVMSDEQFVAQMLAENVWYRDGDVDRCLFLVGGGSHWLDYKVSDNVLVLLEKFYAANPIQPRGTVVPEPPTLVTKKVWLDGAFNFRAAPKKTGAIIKVYNTDKTPGIAYVSVPAVLADGYSWHQYVIEGFEGWVADGVAVVSDRVDPVPPQEMYIAKAVVDDALLAFDALAAAIAKFRV